jgi:two-component system response regulator ResD
MFKCGGDFMRVILIDDEKEMRHLISMCIKNEEMFIEEAGSGEEALKKINEQEFDLIILDILMPSMSGYEVLKKIRNDLELDTPVILLTALGETDQIVKGLQLGADDYIIKPFEPRELVARIESVRRRSKKATTQQTSYSVHQLQIEADKFRATFEGTTIPLTKKEFCLLHRLASHPGRVYSREKLLELEWGLDYGGDIRTVDVHIKNIREKLKLSNYNESIIETVWGIGYQMAEIGDLKNENTKNSI